MALIRNHTCWLVGWAYLDAANFQELPTLGDESNASDRSRQAEQTNAEAAAQIERSRSIVEQAPGIVSVVIGPQHRFELANAACREFWGRSELVGRNVSEVLPEAVEQQFIGMLDGVFKSGVPFVGRRVPVRRFRAETASDEERYVDCIFQPIFDEGGNVLGIYAQGSDVTEQVRADEQQQLLINELNHRVKNTLAIVDGLAYQSFGKLDQGDAYKGFKRRIAALAAAHSLLTDEKWEAAPLRQVIETALQAAAGDAARRFTVSGDDAELSPQVAVSLSMIVHELATNAIKYGALSDPAGRVDVGLTVDCATIPPLMTLIWRETGGPPVRDPVHTGFGTRLIRRGIANHPQAEVTLDFRPGGLACTVKAGVQ